MVKTHGEVFISDKAQGSKGGSAVHNRAPPAEVAKFKTLAAKSQRILLRIAAVFPFDFFPDEIVIDETKVNIINRIFFASENTHSIPFKGIRDVLLETSLFFGTLKICPDGYPGQPICVRFLPKRGAIKARQIIQGLMVVARENIDITNIPDADIINNVESIGESTN